MIYSKTKGSTMSTHATIAAQQADSTYRAIYCHWDGTVAHHGPILTRHYATSACVAALIDLGSLSELGQSIGAAHDFASHAQHREWCLAYGRDRGDDDTEACVCADEGALLAFAEECDAETLFLFRDGAWWSYSGRTASWYAI